LGPDQILVGAAFDVEPGQTLKFYGREFEVAGILDPTGMGLDTTVFIPNDSAYLMAEESVTKAEKPLEIKRDQVSAVLVKLKPESEGGAPAYQAAYDLEMAIPEISVIQRDDLLIKVQKNLSDTLGALRSASYAVWPVTALLIGLVFAMAAHERMREIGLLRAMGATRIFVFRMILIEALMVAGCGMAIGLTASVSLVAGFSRLISMKLEVPFYWPAAADVAFIMIAASALALLTGVIAAMVPAVQSSLMEPYEAIRRGE